MLLDHNGRAVGLLPARFFSACPGPSGFQAESSHAFAAFVEDQSVEVLGQIAKGELRFGTGQPDGANEQPELALLVREDMLDMGPDR
jgi:hypothetical protein